MFFFNPSLNRFLNVKAQVGVFNQEKALVGAFSVIVKMDVILSVCHLCDVEVGELLGHLILAGSLGPLSLGGGARLASHYRGRGVPEHMRNVF